MNLELFEKSRELGELLFTHFGLSGPLVLSASALQKAVQKRMQTPDPDQAAIAAAADRLRNMQAELVEMPSIKAMNDAQTAFSNLLTQVNQVLRFIITGQVDDGSSCGGNCSSCGGSCGSSCGDGCGHDHDNE